MFTSAKQNQKKRSADKNPYKDMGSVKIKLDTDKANNITTIFAKKNGKDAEKLTISKFDDLFEYVGRNAIIQPIIRLKKVYSSKGEPDGDNTLYKCGITMVFEQIIILDSGSTSAGVVHEFINDDGYSVIDAPTNSAVVINPSVPKGTSKNKARNIQDEPNDGELDEKEQINTEDSDSNNEDDQEENQEEDQDDQEENQEDGSEDQEENQEEESEEPEPEPEPPKKPPTKKTITSKRK